MGWKLDQDALADIDAIVSETVRDPVGPEFMAPSERRPEEHDRRHRRTGRGRRCDLTVSQDLG
jgi:hypothetical protein